MLLTENDRDRALARSLCDSIERSTPGFTWQKRLFLIVTTVAWVVVILAAFGLILTGANRAQSSHAAPTAQERTP